MKMEKMTDRKLGRKAMKIRLIAETEEEMSLLTEITSQLLGRWPVLGDKLKDEKVFQLDVTLRKMWSAVLG
ncbi:MAG: hypothetical protein WC705_03115 [Candidatus Paceibacterota bacterium]|jgi:hypothetical protein